MGISGPESIFPNDFELSDSGVAREAIGIDFDLMEELTCRQKWASYIKEEGQESTERLGSYGDIIENEAHSILLKRPDGGMEPSASYIGRDAQGRTWSIQVFDGVADGLEEGVLDDWKRITKNGSLHLVYELDGGSISMAAALQASVTSGGFITGKKETDEDIMEQWIAQLIWTVRYIHQDMNWFVGASLLWSAQNIHLISQNYRLQLFGLGALQLLALSRSPLPYTANEIKSQQMHDLKALSDLIKIFLSGPRRWLVRSANIAPIISFLDQKAASSQYPISDLLALPSSKVLLQKLFIKAFRRQEYLESQLMIQIQSERILGLLCRLNFVVERLKEDESLKSWPSRQPLLLFHNFLFGKKNIPGLPDFEMLHVLGVMRQVDCGSEERILLAKDGAGPSLVLSFAEIGYHLEETYEALLYQ